MRILIVFSIFFLLLLSPITAAKPESLPTPDLNDASTLQEAVRLLDEEVKLAARPQTYVIIDLPEHAILIKARGVELHRFPIERWTAIQLSDAQGTFRLKQRPPVTRRKVDPSAGTEQVPISLDDMPSEFTLVFSPSLTVTVHPSASDHLWQWLRFNVRQWWRWLKKWSVILTTGHPPPSQPSVNLTVTSDHAQSLAWTVTEGMPFLLRRTALPQS